MKLEPPTIQKPLSGSTPTLRQLQSCIELHSDIVLTLSAHTIGQTSDGIFLVPDPYTIAVLIHGFQAREFKTCFVASLFL